MQHPVKRSPAVCPIRSATSFWWSSAPPSCSYCGLPAVLRRPRGVASDPLSTCTPARPSCCPASSPEGLSGCVCRQSALFSGFMNSIKYTVIGTIYSVVMIYLVAYPLSVGICPGTQVHQPVLRHHMYFGGGLVPTYLIVKQTGLLGSMGAYSCPVSWRWECQRLSATSFENNIPRGAAEAAEHRRYQVTALCGRWSS